MPLRNTIIALLCPLFNLHAQSNEITPLKIGDPVPDIEFPIMINHYSESARLSDFKGKLIILDFWATSCTSCLRGFPKLDSLQKEFRDDLQILLINSKMFKDDFNKVNLYFRNWNIRTGNKLNLPSSVTDTIAIKYFPHKRIPHYVWIDKSGKLIAFSNVEVVNASNIRAVLEGRIMDFTMKIDQDISKPLFTNENLPEDDLLNYSIFLKGQLAGLPGGERLRYRDKKPIGMVLTNRTILEMYQTIARRIKPDFDNRHFVIELEILSKLIPPDGPYDLVDWNNNNHFSFDYIIANMTEPQMFEQMLNQLNKQSGYYGGFEKRRMKCYVLRRTSKSDKLKTIGGIKENMLWDKKNPHLNNVSMDILVKQLNYKKIIKEIIINETNYKDNIDICFPDGLSDLISIQKQLSPYGLRLKEVYREIEVFVLGEK